MAASGSQMMAMDYYQNYSVYHYGTYGGPFHSSPGLPPYGQGHAHAHGGNAVLARQAAMLQQSAAGKTTESKPRLAKEEVEQLEAEFKKNQKPNSSLKKGLAEQMRVDIARINNWFQNRRAKAKQERRTMETEARRKSEQSSESSGQDAVKEYYSLNNHHDDLRPSTAPFPPIDTPANPLAPYQETTSETLESLNRPMETNQNTQSEDDESEYASPGSAHFQGPEQTFSYALPESNYFPVQSSRDYSSVMASQTMDQQMPNHLSLSIPDNFSTIHDSSNVGSFAPFQAMSRAGLESPMPMPSQYLPQDPLNSIKLEVEEEQLQQESVVKFEHFSPESMTHSPPPPTATPDLRFKSPSAIDIASRRNMKRPAALGVNSTRSMSFQAAPKTGIEMSRRPDAPSPMRRVASATGTMPRGIHKPMSATPRSPLFFERNQESLLRLASQSPIVQGSRGSIAPPTPNTPLVANHQVTRETTASSTCSEEEKGYTFQSGIHGGQFSMDPTMRTPPATPGLMQNFTDAMFPSSHLHTGFEYTISDEPLVTPGLGSFDSNDFPTMPNTIPNYVNCASQPATPSYPPTTMGPAFFPSYSGSNPEYNWSDASEMSAKSSPGQSKSRQFQFTNMTPQDFNAESLLR